MTQLLKEYNTNKVRQMSNDKVDYILNSLRQKDQNTLKQPNQDEALK